MNEEPVEEVEELLKYEERMKKTLSMLESVHD